MGNLICIYIEDLDEKRSYPIGTSLQTILNEIASQLKMNVLGAIVNNKLKELTYEIYKPKNIKFVDYTNPAGRRMYIRSLTFVLYKAVQEVFPNAGFRVEHSVSNGEYCRLTNKNTILTEEGVLQIKARMQSIVEANLPFERNEIETEKAIELFESQGLHEKTKLLRTRGNLYTSVYKIGSVVDYFYGFLLPRTGLLDVFDLQHYHNGMLLLAPNKKDPSVAETRLEQEKMFQIFSEYKRWGKILGISNIGDLNKSIEEHKISELIKIYEAMHEKKISQIADRIRKKWKKIKIILIAGPSSSGKTTFGKRLSIQLKVSGIQPINLSLDNYFVNRELTPLDENGEYDFESIEALDVKLFNENLLELLDGKEIDLPKFSFETGQRYYDGEKLRINGKNVIVIEGIHALNPELTSLISDEVKFKIYISALTSISIDGHNLLHSTDNRLIRRIVRDHKYRNYSALDTIKRWQSVRNGEEKNIFPFQENADVMFNSALPYELGVLKRHVEPILKEVQPNQPEYSEANRLLKFFSFFIPIPDNEIPKNSLMREFLGGSTFEY
ncbi:nucleoside kinase [Ancylomarina euxinus]|uniref:Nucleoside kinase n=1 Tax=Ancylomarina euxinus TaxID=2283627 RepID=A0A425Y530_9BACT|nr:nucleoside kinase [Ancylomarina euxinus]MCZ4694397.1 nucleoside kinase [Ancylomarina euxinus]MUP14273.1 nucleoside kinase [Ancylomarina euxinus]RRG23592.1 nucleoside kinase [Ancylomarina euxinus]